MHAFLLQDWLTLRGHSQASGSPMFISQTETEILDLWDYLDTVFWLQVSNVTLGGASAINVLYGSGPTADQALVNGFSLNETLATISVTTPGVTVSPFLCNSGGLYIARYVRWLVSPATLPTTGSWDITFRIYVMANAPGKMFRWPSRTSPLGRKLCSPAAPSVPLHIQELMACSACATGAKSCAKCT